MLTQAGVTALIPAQGKARVSQVLPAREEKKASLWGGKHMGWVDSPHTRCCYTSGGSVGEKGREKELSATLRKELWVC